MTDNKELIERLQTRLEIDPRHNYDAIDCRDTTIRELERENAELTTKCNHIMTEHGKLLAEVQRLREQVEARQ